jgi:hypothetical protein
MQLPDFEEAERSGKEVTDPTGYPVLCEIPNWDVQCWQAFTVFEEIAVDNLELAQLNADIARDSDAAYDHILNAAKAQQEISKIREEMLEQERRDHLFDNVKYLAIIGVGILGVAL